jgi:four helix bundle protein
MDKPVTHPCVPPPDRPGTASSAGSPGFDLEDRLLDYSIAIIRLVEALPSSRAGNHVGGQLIRSGTSPLPNHGEAQAAESRADFVHKMRICLKELRESRRWIRLICRAGWAFEESPGSVCSVLNETEQLIRIFAASLRTATRNDPRSRGSG